jgi:hypothetical protein
MLTQNAFTTIQPRLQITNVARQLAASYSLNLHGIVNFLRAHMSAVDFDNLITVEIDRLDDLFNELPSRQHAFVDDPTLELPGIAVIASRTNALRRELLARIASRKIPQLNLNNPDESLLLIPNHSARIFMRQMIATMSKIGFEVLDEATLGDDDWPRLTSGVNLLGLGSDGESFVGNHRFNMIETPLSTTDMVALIGATKHGTTVVLENYHMLRGLGDNTTTFADLRNAAVSAGVYLYMGCGLSHWHEVREKGGVYLSDLAECMTEAVHVADLITVLTPNVSGARAVVFDARYGAPWKGDLRTLLEK